MEDLLSRWEAAARRLLAQKMALDDEVNKERELSVCELFRSSGWYPVSQHLNLFLFTRQSKSRERMTILHSYSNMSRSSIMQVSYTIFSKSMRMESHRKPLVNRHRLQACAIPSRASSHVGFVSGVLRIGAVILLPASERLRINFVSGSVHDTESSRSVQYCVGCPCSTYSVQPPNCLCGVVYTANYLWMA